MKRALSILTAVVAAAGVGLVLWPVGSRGAGIAASGDPLRGAYLARISGCVVCHTASPDGGQALAGGVEFATEFGVFVSPNITPDPETGIGSWSIDDFARAVRQGVSPGRQPYYPVFPYAFFRDLSDQDIADLWAAFQTVPAVASAPVRHDLRFPYNLRPGLKVWRALSPPPALPPRDDTKSDAWNRGQYLVNGPAHCGACHTPRDQTGARLSGMALAGTDALPEGQTAPNITFKEMWNNYWAVDTLKYALATGIRHDLDTFDGGMAKVVREITSFMTEGDRTAMALYLMDQNRE